MPKKRKPTTDRLAVQNAAKTLLANVRFASVDSPIQAITVTSATPNEGKTTVAVNLAQAIATSGASVCLVECDMRRRSLSEVLGVHARGGLYAVLSNQISLKEAVLETDQQNLYFLDAEPHIPNPADILMSHRFAKLVDALKERFRYVVFDTPPVGTFVDAAEVGQLSDGVLFVIRENFTKRSDVMTAFDQLRKAEVNVIGTVMNYCSADTSEYYYAYYTKDGKRVRTSDDMPAPAVPATPRTARPVADDAAAAASAGTRFAR